MRQQRGADCHAQSRAGDQGQSAHPACACSRDGSHRPRDQSRSHAADRHHAPQNGSDARGIPLARFRRQQNIDAGETQRGQCHKRHHDDRRFPDQGQARADGSAHCQAGAQWHEINPRHVFCRDAAPNRHCDPEHRDNGASKTGSTRQMFLEIRGHP